MELPFILYLTGISQAFPLVTAAVAWRRLTTPRAVLVAWATVSTLVNIAQRLIALRGSSNLWLMYVSLPLDAVLMLLALGLWQTRDLPRQTFRAAIPGSLLVYGALVVSLENTGSFSAVALPFYALLGLGGALFTLVARAIDETESLLDQDWFWITGGMALYFGSLAILLPMAKLLIGAHQELVDRAWQLFGAIGIIANVLIAVGMLCPIPARPQPSGASSSPASSASASPSPPSPSR